MTIKHLLTTIASAMQQKNNKNKQLNLPCAFCSYKIPISIRISMSLSRHLYENKKKR